MKLLSLLSKILLLTVVLYAVNSETAISAPAEGVADTVKQAQVISVRSLDKRRKAGVAVLGDFIELKVENLDQLLGKDNSCCGEKTVCDSTIILCFNGIARPDMRCYDVNRVEGTLLFKFDRDSSKTVSKLSSLTLRPWQNITLSNITVCLKGGKMIATKVSKLNIWMMPHKTLFTIALFILALLITFYFLFARTSIIRVGDNKSQFSLAQTQLGYWTILIAVSVIYIWAVSGFLPNLTDQTLVLMGISVVTIAGGKAVSYSQQSTVSDQPSKGLILDIISDHKSPNIHRLQMVVWTLLIGTYFLFKVVSTLKFPELDSNYLILTGISSGTYVLLKTSENAPTNPTVTPAAPPVQPAADAPANNQQ